MIVPALSAARPPAAPARGLAALLVALVVGVPVALGLLAPAAYADPVASSPVASSPVASSPVASSPVASSTATPAQASVRAGDEPLLPPGQEAPAPQPQPEPAVPTPASDGSASGDGWSVLGLVGIGALSLVSVALTVVATTTLAWMLHAWRSTDSLRATGFTGSGDSPRRRFSLLVPARHEEEVLGHTLDRLAESDHPDFEIIAIVGHDDPGTEAVARAAADRHPDLVRVVVDHSEPKNKPRGMNTALPEVTGDVVGVFDAEDWVHPRLLGLVDDRFSETGADIVQGGVQLMNVQSSWWAMRNCLEYYFWFRSRLHFHAEARFIPLGGNTVFVRTDLLRDADGWDGDCLAEDCELGVRLSTGGAKVAVAYDAEVVTREETPGSIPALFKQRTRWSQGFLQVLRKGIWKELPTFRQRALARYTLAMPFLQAFTGLMIPVSVLLVLFAEVPVLVALLTFLPVVPTVVTLVVEAAGLGEFGRSYGVKVRFGDYVRLVLGTFPYQVLLAGAALRAAWREARGDGSWEKTEHTGAHLDRPDEPSVPAQRRPSDDSTPDDTDSRSTARPIEEVA